MTLTKKRANACTMMSMNAVRGLSLHTKSFPYQTFEAAFLSWVAELDLGRLSRPAEVDRVIEIEARIAEQKTRQAVIEKQMVEGDVTMMATLAGAAAKVEATLKNLFSELEGEKATRSTAPVTATAIGQWAKSMADLDGEAKTALRSKIKGAISSLCQRIRVYIYGNTVKRILFAHVLLANGADRVFQVISERGKEPITRSENLTWAGFQQDAELTAALFDKLAADELAG